MPARKKTEEEQGKPEEQQGGKPEEKSVTEGQVQAPATVTTPTTGGPMAGGPITIPNQIQVQIFPSIWCPECGVQLEGRSPTGLIKGGRNVYTHPFQGESSQKIKEQGIEVVRMAPCTLRGKAFEAPRLFLTEVPKPTIGKK